MRLFCLVLAMISSGILQPAAAQELSSKQRASVLLRSVAERYRSNKVLHFTMHYRYAAEEKPGVWLDSLKGDFTISGDRYRYSLDSTEFIGGKDFAVILFKQDQVMYLSKGTTAMQGANPMALLDSLLLKNDSVDCSLQETNDRQTIVLTFRPVRTTKRIEYVIDRHTGFIIKMISVVSARELYDPSVRQKVAGDPTYAIVETDLADYHETAIVEKDWDPGLLFKKEGKEYIPLPPYQSYKIFLGTPDL